MVYLCYDTGMVRTVIAGNEFGPLVTSLIGAAQSCIDITVFDWRWFPYSRGPELNSFNQSIKEALQRGVKIRAVVQQKVLVQDLKKLGIEAKKIYTRGLMHSKLIIIDNRYVVIGSHNLTQAAFSNNHEISVVLDCADNCGGFNSFFNNLYSQGI